MNIFKILKMIMMNQIVNYIKKNNLYFTLGIILIMLTIWNRVIRLRLPKNINDFNNIYMINIIYLNIILLTVILITTIWLLWFKNNSKSQKSKIATYFLKYKNIINILDYFINIWGNIMQSPKTVYKLFYNTFNISHILEIPFYKISHFIKNLPIKYAYILTLIHIMLYLLPRIIPPIVFIIELFFFQHLVYFYKSLFLYLVVILYNILLWILADLADNNIYFSTAHIDLKHTKYDLTAVFRKENPVIENAVDIVTRQHDGVLLKWFVYIYETYLDIKWLTYRLNLEKDKYKDYERLFINTMYLCGWCYVLIKITDDFSILKDFQENVDPFSGMIL